MINAIEMTVKTTGGDGDISWDIYLVQWVNTIDCYYIQGEPRKRTAFHSTDCTTLCGNVHSQGERMYRHLESNRMKEKPPVRPEMCSPFKNRRPSLCDVTRNPRQEEQRQLITRPYSVPI